VNDPSPQTSDDIRARLLAARRDLVDIGGRTRLLNTNLGAAGLIRIVGELADEMHRRLVVDGRPMIFEPDEGDRGSGKSAAPSMTAPVQVPVDDAESAVADEVDKRDLEPGTVLFGDDEPPSVGGDEEEASAPPRADDAVEVGAESDDDGPLSHQIDDRLQTELTAEVLDRRLLKLSYDARTAQEEQGVNLLHLAVGFLRWREEDRDGALRVAPLLLIPVQLERLGAGTRFRVAHLDDEIVGNVSLQERLRGAFGIELPMPEDQDELVPSAYMARVAKAIEGREGWEVIRDDAALGLYSFAGFLMWRDLDPARWPEGRSPDAHPLVEALLGGRCPGQPPSICDDDEPLDTLLPPERCLHVLDADSSQAIAIAEVVHNRRSMVIQGPPGTGKSQTIANIIAGAIAEGRRVLFIAEKRAALEVVQRRLDGLGLGVACLELHSTRANRRAVLQAIDETLQLGRPRSPDRESQIERLRDTVARLNSQAQRLHARDEVSGCTLHAIIGEVVRLQTLGHTWRRLRLDGAELWDQATRRRMVELVRTLADQVRRIGVPDAHPWRGVGLDALLPTDLPRVREAIASARAAVADAMGAVAPTVDALAGAAVPAESLDALAQLVALARHLAARPNGASSVDAETWELHGPTIDAALDRFIRHRAARDRLEPLLAPGAAAQPIGALRADLAATSRSPLRWLRPRWWSARRRLREMLAPRADIVDPLVLIDQVVAMQSLAQAIAADEPLLARAFGGLWIGERSEPAALDAVRRWIAAGRSAKLPADPLRLADVRIDGEAVRTVEDALQRPVDALAALGDALVFDWKLGFGAETPGAVAIAALRQRLDAWSASSPAESAVALEGWIGWRRHRDEAIAAGLAGAVLALSGGIIGPEEIEPQLLVNMHEALMKRIDPNGEVIRSDGSERERLRDEFAQLDRQRIALARAEVALAHFERLPSPGDVLGQMAIIRREIVKRRRHLPIRRLLAEAGESIQRIRPVFMMSPPSVAQFLEPGRLEFDLVLMDEASQVRPVEALGAVARLAPDGQVVVVGDDRQLPPTAFFRAMAEDDATVDDDGALEAVRDVESVLGLCVAAGLPSRMLRWHYRSEHHSLIAVSNRAFYDSRLYVIPSPQERDDERGLMFRHLPETAYDRGGTGTNRGEAEAVAEMVIRHAQRWPELTLGVATFSVRQRDAVLECLERSRRERPELESFFGEGGAEPFFVKNLENIQGDERDVILISVGYGRTAEGYLTMNFGPVSQDGGQRRLNVLITRARRRCVVFSSLTDDDIDLSRATGLGPQALKMFLRYARVGELDVGLPTGRDFGSEFERQVALALSSLGWTVEAQVGVAGFFVDLAVRDPERPGRFLLGIECDGAAYHSARWARDRDRLRQAVLEARGWTIHRIWSTDWFRRRDAELARLVAALGDRVARARREDASAAEVAVAADRVDGAQTPSEDGQSAEGAEDRDDGRSVSGIRTADAPPPIEREARTEVDEPASLTEPYREARVRVPVRTAPQDVAEARLAEIVVDIVRQEGPLHEDEIPRRIAGLWGLRRTGSRIDEVSRHATAIALADHRVIRDGHFLSMALAEATGAPGGVEPAPERTPRRRDASVAAALRRPEALPPSEVRTLLRLIVERHYGIAREDVLAEARRQFGYGALSAPLRAVFEAQLDRILLDGTVEQRGTGLFRPSSDRDRAPRGRVVG